VSALTVEVVEAAALALSLRRKFAIVAPRESPLVWAHAHAVLRTADGRVLRYGDVARDYQDAILADPSDRIIIAKSRQIGISQVVAFLAAHEALNAGTVLWLSRDGEQASLALDYIYTALSRCEHPAYTTENRQSLELANGGKVITQPATRSAGRGIAATLVVIDEQAWQEYARLIWTAVLPTLATTGGRLIIMSSANGRGNLFHELWQAAQVPDSGWSAHFLPWDVHPDWDDAWAAAREADLGAEGFAQEHGADFMVSGAAVFEPEDVEAAFRLDRLAGVALGHRYVSAFDIARRRDAFVGATLDISTSPFTLAAFERALRLPYPSQARQIEARQRTYPGETVVESNGPGDPLIEFLAVAVEGFQTTAMSKRQALDALKLLLQRRELALPTPEAMPDMAQVKRELLVYQYDDKDLVQDCVMALAIAALKAGRPAATASVYDYRRGVAR
jgi:hypothetical protein